jgi:hypothetical protein
MTSRILPWAVFGVFVVYVGVATLAMPSRSASSFDLRDFRRLPVSVSGRVQPVDTVARLALQRIRRSATVPPDQSGAGPVRTGALDADEWLLEVLSKPDTADTRRIFPIGGELAGKLSLKAAGAGTSYYSFRDLTGKVEDIGGQAQRIAKLKSDTRAAWEGELLNLRERLVIYERLKNSLQPNSGLQRDAKGNAITFDFAQALGRYRVDLSEAVRTAAHRKEGRTETLDKATEQRLRAFAAAFQAVARVGLVAMVPPHVGEPRNHWSNAGTEIANSARGAGLSPAVVSYAKMGAAYARGDAATFTAAASAYRTWLASSGLQREVNRAAWEVFYNRLQPMFRSLPVYLLGLLLLFAGNAATGETPAARRTRPVYQAAVLLILLGFALQTTGIAFSFPLAGRPSFLVFAGWATALCGLVIEWFSRRGLGMAVAAIAAVVGLMANYVFGPGTAGAFVRAVFDVNLLVAVLAAGAALCAHLVGTRSTRASTTESKNQWFHGDVTATRSLGTR